MLTVASVMAFSRGAAPPRWPPTGTMSACCVGKRAAEVRRVMTCLTVTPHSAAEAVAEGVQLVVTHGGVSLLFAGFWL